MRRPLFLFSFLIAALLIFEGVLIWRTDSDDEKAYLKLIKSSEALGDEGKDPLKGKARQIRVQSQKQLWNLSKLPPQKVKVESLESELYFVFEDKAIRVEELMKGVLCYFQQELFFLSPQGEEYLLQKNKKFLKRGGSTASDWWTGDPGALSPVQRVRLLKMDEAIFVYQNNTLEASSVKVIDYLAYSHSLEGEFEPFETLMEGFADRVVLTFDQDPPKFEADRLKATFFSQRGFR